MSVSDTEWDKAEAVPFFVYFAAGDLFTAIGWLSYNIKMLR